MHPEPDAWLSKLPLEVFYQVLSHLPLCAIYQLGATCRHFHRKIHQNEHFWRFQVMTQTRILFDSSEEGAEADIPRLGGPSVAVIRDPSLQGHKELFLLCSAEFQAVFRAWRQAQAQREYWARLLHSWLPRAWRSLPGFFDPDFAVRCALFGPGIESPKTKYLVHKMIKSHTDLFNATGFVTGLPGGFGAGVQLDFRQMYQIDLICLYTNSERVREYQRGVERLLAVNNRLIDPEDEAGQQPHALVLRLLPTLHCVFYALDSSELGSQPPERLAEELKYLRGELEIMLNGLRSCDMSHLPILVLSCTPGNETGLSVEHLSQALGLHELSNRPWAVFNVNIANMEGMTKGLDWVLYHAHKRRASLEYHQNQSTK